MYLVKKTWCLKQCDEFLSSHLPDLWITDFRKYHFPFWDPSGEGNAIIPFSKTARTLSFFPSILRILSLQSYLIVLKLSLTLDSEFDNTTTSPTFKVPRNNIVQENIFLVLLCFILSETLYSYSIFIPEPLVMA